MAVTRTGSAAVHEGFELWRSAMRWQRQMDKALSPLGLTHTQYLVLLATAAAQADHRDAVSQRTIAERAGLDEATTSRVASTLSDRGLLDRGITHGDRRALRVIVSSTGTRMLGRAQPLAEAAARKFLSKG